MTRILAALAACLCIVILAWAAPVQAQVPCLIGPPDMLEKILAQSGEEPLIEMQFGGGADKPSAPGLLAVSPDGTFTLFMLDPSGAICILAAGTHTQPATGDGFPKPIVPGRDS